MGGKTDIWQGTLALMVLKTLEAMGPQHGYGLARRIEQTSGDAFSINYGTLYPALLKLEQEGYVSSEWGVSDNNRRARFYELTPRGRKRVSVEASNWRRLTAALAVPREVAKELQSLAMAMPGCRTGLSRACLSRRVALQTRVKEVHLKGRAATKVLTWYEDEEVDALVARSARRAPTLRS